MGLIIIIFPSLSVKITKQTEHSSEHLKDKRSGKIIYMQLEVILS